MIDFGINISVVSRPTQVVLRGNLHLPAGGGGRIQGHMFKGGESERGGGR